MLNIWAKAQFLSHHQKRLIQLYNNIHVTCTWIRNPTSSAPKGAESEPRQKIYSQNPQWQNENQSLLQVTFSLFLYIS